MKYYAVRKGSVPGIYTSWDDCKSVVHGFPGAIYKSFTKEADAIEYLNKDCDCQAKIQPNDLDIDGTVAYVDGSFNEEKELYSCGIVILTDENETHISDIGNNPALLSMRNIAGELLGATLAMQYARENDIEKLTIVHDYQGIASWCTGEWAAKKQGTAWYKEFFDDISQDIEINFQKVRGHSGVFYNNVADALARKELGLSVRAGMLAHIEKIENQD